MEGLVNDVAACGASATRLRLPPGFQAKMEAAFGDSFADVAIDTGRTARRLTFLHGTIACTDGDTLFFAPGCYRPDLAAGQRVIAHELAHVVQKRRARKRLAPTRRGPVADWRIEAEAEAAAIVAVNGRSCRGLSGDASGMIRAWGPAGHYYTCYVAALAAGIPEDAAARAAFFCQMPDQVANFDAKEAGEDYVLTVVLPVLLGHGKDVTAHALELMEVQRGLHCLTGRDSSAETQLRVDVLKQQSRELGSAIFGLALHALGDSFAHRNRSNPSVMYDAPYGHFYLELKWGQSVDNIKEHANLYKNYASTLFAALLAIGKTLNFRPLLEQGVFDAAIASFCSGSSDEARQIDTIRNYCKDKLKQLNSYAPEAAEPDPMPWDEFHLRHGGRFKFDHALLNNIQFTIRDWSLLRLP